MPYVNPKTHPNHDHDHDIFGHTTTVIIIPTTRRPPFIVPNINTIDDLGNHNIPFRPNLDGFATGDVAATSASGAGAGAVAAADGPAAITPTHAYTNRNVMQSNVNGIFMPASTSKYPIKQSTITEDFRERFRNFVEHWTNAFVYLSRKWKLKLLAMSGAALFFFLSLFWQKWSAEKVR